MFVEQNNKLRFFALSEEFWDVEGIQRNLVLQDYYDLPIRFYN